MNLRPTEILIILFVLILLFGAKRLPDTARALGDSLKVFKKSVRDEDRDSPTVQRPREITAAAPATESGVGEALRTTS